MTQPRVDLHVHTHHSDGLHPPVTLLAEMSRLGMELVAITDHDTVAAHHELANGATSGGDLPQVIAGVEINSVAEHVPEVPEGELHILGLGIDPTDLRLERAMTAQRLARTARIAAMVRRLALAGAAIDEQLHELSPDAASVGRPHLARALVRAGHVTDFQEAFDRYLAPEGLAYVPRVGMTTFEAIDLIVGAGGLAVLAHFSIAAERADVVAELKDRGLGGLETYYSKWSPSQVAAVAAVAQRLELLPTAGTDYHGDRGPYEHTVARIHPPADLAERVLEALQARGAAASPGRSPVLEPRILPLMI